MDKILIPFVVIYDIFIKLYGQLEVELLQLSKFVDGGSVKESNLMVMR